MLSNNIGYFKSKPVKIPKITILLDNGYHPEKLMEKLKKTYPQIVNKIEFKLSPKPSKAQKKKEGKTGFVPVKARWVIERSNSWMERCKSLVKNFERTLENATTKTLSHSGVEIRGRSRRLRLNYRTTDEIRKWASKVLAGSKFDDLDGGKNDLSDYRSLLHGQEPLVKVFKNFDEEVQYLAEQLQQIEQQEKTLSSSCLMLRTRSLIKSYSHALNNLGII